MQTKWLRNMSGIPVAMIEGSIPLTSAMKVRCMHIKYYDQANNIATFSTEEMVITREDGMLALVLVLCHLIRETIGVLYGWSSNVNGWETCIGVAGSSALAVLEGIMRKSKSGDGRGRWGRGSTWKPWNIGDVDVFVAGLNGESVERFNEFVAVFTRVLIRSGRQNGFSVVGSAWHNNLYAVENHIVKIVDITFRGVDLKLSLVQAPCASNMKDVVDRFDIDVAKVIYNPMTGLVHAPLPTVWAVETGNAKVKNFELKAGFPTVFQVAAINSTLKRMIKYGKRGYTFADYPQLRAHS